MTTHHSVILTALVPKAISEIDVFEACAELSQAYGIDTIEFYADVTQTKERGWILAQRGMRGVYLAAAMQKKTQQHLCDVNPVKAAAALDVAKRCIDAAVGAGLHSVLLTGGRYPENPIYETAAWQTLEDNLTRLLEYADGRVFLSLEPGDRSVDARQLAGPTDETVEMAKRLIRKYEKFGLTMDTSHIVQLNEDPYAAIYKARDVCDHFHIANCILKEGNPKYGDKHPWFDEEDVLYTREKLQKVTEYALETLTSDVVTLGLEIIDNGSAELLERALKIESWYLKMKKCSTCQAQE